MDDWSDEEKVDHEFPSHGSLTRQKILRTKYTSLVFATPIFELDFDLLRLSAWTRAMGYCDVMDFRLKNLPKTQKLSNQGKPWIYCPKMVQNSSQTIQQPVARPCCENEVKGKGKKVNSAVQGEI